MNCTEFMAKLTDFLDEHVDAPLRADLQIHMENCEHCLVTYNTTQQTIQIYRDNELYELPDPLRERLLSAIMDKCRHRSRHV